MTAQTTRRAAIGAIGLALPVAAISAASILPAGEDEALSYSDGTKAGQEIATFHMARAWIDRWHAAGGNFAISRNMDGSFRDLLRGMVEPSFWTPTDAGNPKLQPHEWLIDPQYQRGAVKVLESLLTLVPGLHDAVTEIVGHQLLADAQPVKREG